MARYGDIKKILKSHNLRVTDGRIDVLAHFLRKDGALSIKDLQDELKESDRVTLYRILSAFTKNGVLHKIPDDSGMITYGLCHDTCGVDNHQHDHMHFKCDECGVVECLDQVIPMISIPGYKVKEANLILKGICKRCAA